MSKAQSQFRPRRFWRCVLIVVAAPLVLWALANLLGATELGTSLIEKEIKNRIGLECRIERLSWTPWGGGAVRGLELASDSSSSPIVRVGKIVIDPSWKSMFQRQRRFDSLLIEDGELDLTVEEICKIFESREARSKVWLTDADQKIPQKQGDDQEPKVPELERKEVPIREESEANDKKTPLPTLVPTDDFEGEILLKNIDLKVSSIKRPDLALELYEIDGEIPLWGGERSGELVFSKVRIGGDGNVEKLDLPLVWRNQKLEVDESEIHLLGVRFSLKASVRLVLGLPFGVAVDLPPQRINSTSMGEHAFPIDIHSFRSRNTVQGYLRHPTILYGSSQTEIGVSELLDTQDGSRVRFEKGRADFTLNPGGLFSPDFHLIGEQDAILGNGFVSIGGEGAATVRIVASPVKAHEYEKRIQSISPDWTLAFEPLVTPDRVHRDLRFDLSKGGLIFDLGVDGKAVSFREAFAKIKRGRSVPIAPKLP
ncbi:MAG: hypothetical protein ACON5H_01410 [Akkermansiaceae bacterium]